MDSKWLKCALVAIPLLAATDCFAAQRLAVGAAGEGRYPVYVVSPRGGTVDIPDTTFGVFREPIYTTPRNYRYTYVRGYRYVPRAQQSAQIVVKKKAVVAAAKPKRHKVVKRIGGCVSDLDYGRYEYCN
jgi:hypothetical protein